MVKKARSSSRSQRAAASSLLDNPLAQSVRASAQQVWRAGMGALSKAQRGRPKGFAAWVGKTSPLRRKTRSAVPDKAGEAGRRWGRLEQIFEQRTAKALGRLGVPTAKDVHTLIERVDALALAVQRLSVSAPAAAPPGSAAAAQAARRAKPPTQAAARKADATRRAKRGG